MSQPDEPPIVRKWKAKQRLEDAGWQHIGFTSDGGDVYMQPTESQPTKKDNMIERYHVKKALVLAAIAALLGLVVSYLLSIPATDHYTDIWGHEHSHTPGGFVWAEYIFISLAIVFGAVFGGIEVWERVK